MKTRLQHYSDGFRQQGTTTVEFAIVGSLIFLVLFAVLEVGRLMYTWNLLNEASRRAARLATVCRVQEVQNNTVASAVANQLGGALPGFTAGNLVFTYMDRDGVVLADPAGADADKTTGGFIRASIANYRYEMVLPLNVDLSRFAPDFSSVLRAESLGITPDGNAICDATGE
ncbi:pilus assembly protein [Oceanimonas sp. NS1]|nr:pilus assembly protein [Oceanimonas sp. NS1]